MPPRIGLIGLGSIGRRHLGNLLALDCEVFAFDPDPAARALAKTEHPAVQFDAQMDGDYDALVIASPAGNHLHWVEEAISREVPFFVEKPLGTISQLPAWRDIDALVDLPVNQVGYMLRFHPGVAHMKLMEPTGGEFWLLWDAEKYGYRLEESSHEIDLALHFGADVSELVVPRHDRMLFGPWGIRIRDHSPRYYRQWHVHRGLFSTSATFRTPEALGDEMYVAEMQHFLLRVQSGDPTDCTLADGLKVLEVCAQIEALR